jgi:hypothetical protein
MIQRIAVAAALAALIFGCTGTVTGPTADTLVEDAGGQPPSPDGGQPPGPDGGQPPGPDGGQPPGPDGGPGPSDGGTPVISADRVTTWNPGILADSPLGLALGADGLPQRTTLCATVNPGGNIQAAIDSCPANQVVQLSAGTFTISSTIQLKSNVVLRGTGSGTGGTTIVKTGGGTVLAIGTERDQICYSGNGQGVALTADAPKDTTSITVGSAASTFHVGDLIVIDQVDATPVVIGDCLYFKRHSGSSYRSIAQVDQVTAVNASAGTLSLGAALHWSYTAGSPTFAQAYRINSSPTVSWAGIESLRIQGGTAGSYDGQSAGGIDIANAAFCWVKDVQTDQTIGGMHVRLGAVYRSVVRDSYFHNSANYGFALDCYGIVLGCFSADNLIENNIARYMNKPILMSVSGGGNVIGYNYADNSWANNDWQENNIDCHCSFPHMELIEGNYAPHMGATATHGNAGYLTFFRNYGSTVFASPSVADSSEPRGNNITAFELDGIDVGMNVVGNVLGTAGVTQVYDQYIASQPPSIYELGEGTGGTGQSSTVVQTLFRTGNYDYYHQATEWNNNVQQALPDSLYLKQQPAWWPAGTTWPWAGPDLSPMVQQLPAKARSDGM